MPVVPRLISAELSYQVEYTLCTLMTNPQEYAEMLESAVQAGFNDENTEFLCMDNSNGNQFDGYSGINRAILEAKGRYLIFCHQDVLFCFDKKPVLDASLQELNKIDSRWAVAGNAGKDTYGHMKIRITDPHTVNIAQGDFPEKVMSLDENFLVINRENPVFCSTNMSGFHLYATDFCLNAQESQLSAYVINFHILHKSGGKLDQSYFLSMNRLIDSHSTRQKTQVVFTTCSSFLITRSRLLFLLFGSQWMLKRVRKLLKVFFNKRA